MPQNALAINDPLHSNQYQKAYRIYHRENPPAEIAFEREKNSVKPSKKARKESRRKLHEERKNIAAQSDFVGNTHAVKMSELRRETDEMVELLESVDSTKGVRIQGKNMTLRDYAINQAWSMSLCSTKAVYQFWPDEKKFAFKHACRCGRRTCSLCGHFDSLEQARMLETELVDKIMELSEEEKLRGRLVHIVLTHESVQLDRVMDVMKAWRHVQQMKKREYKKKENPYQIWRILEWGLARWEVTRDDMTGLYHPHMHILAWADGWLAPETGGYWNQLVNSWIETCEKILGLKAAWQGQNMGAVCYFSERKDDPKAIHGTGREDVIAQITKGAAAEMVKYPVKSTDFTKLESFKKRENYTQGANELAELLAKMHGRKLMNGFGGFKLREVEETEKDMTQDPEYIDENEITDRVCMEAIFTWNKSTRSYKLWVIRDWDQQRFEDYMHDLSDYKMKTSVIMGYGLERESKNYLE